MSSVMVIAEVGSNFTPHDLDSALAMVHVAKKCGADIVKFQDFRVDNMDRPQWWKNKSRPWEMCQDWPAALASEARALKMGFLCSVWDFTSIINAKKLSYPAIKIAASEIGDQLLLRTINYGSASGLICGRGIYDRVWLSVDYRRHAALVPALSWLPDCEVTLLHCVSEYPVSRPSDLDHHWDAFFNLTKYGRPFGLSSHWPYPRALKVAAACVREGAEVVEVHLRTKETPKECPDNGAWAMYPEQFGELVGTVREAE